MNGGQVQEPKFRTSGRPRLDRDRRGVSLDVVMLNIMGLGASEPTFASFSTSFIAESMKNCLMSQEKRKSTSSTLSIFEVYVLILTFSNIFIAILKVRRGAKNLATLLKTWMKR